MIESSEDVVSYVLDALIGLGVRYFVTGSIASNAYSEVRSTIDADFVVALDPESFTRLRAILLREMHSEDQLAFETVTGKTQHQFIHLRSKFMIEIFEADFNDAHERSRFSRLRQETFLGRIVWFPSPEDVVVQKLRWLSKLNRSKDREDVIQVLYHQWGYLDWKYIEHWCIAHQSHVLLAEVRAEAARIRALDAQVG